MRNLLYTRVMNLSLWRHLNAFSSPSALISWLMIFVPHALQECRVEKTRKSPRTSISLDNSFWCRNHALRSDIRGHLPRLINMHGLSLGLSDLPEQQWHCSLIYGTPLLLPLYTCQRRAFKNWPLMLGRNAMVPQQI